MKVIKNIINKELCEYCIDYFNTNVIKEPELKDNLYNQYQLPMNKDEMIKNGLYDIIRSVIDSHNNDETRELFSNLMVLWEPHHVVEPHHHGSVEVKINFGQDNHTVLDSKNNRHVLEPTDCIIIESTEIHSVDPEHELDSLIIATWWSLTHESYLKKYGHLKNREVREVKTNLVFYEEEKILFKYFSDIKK